MPSTQSPLHFDLAQGKGSRAGSLAVKKYAAAAIVSLGIGGAAVWSLGGSKQDASARGETTSDQGAQVSAASPSTAAAPVPASTATAPAEPALPKDPAPAETNALDSGAADELFKVADPTHIDDCDKALKKPEAYYKKQPKWKGAQAWKLARKYLLQGKDALAFEQMCQSVTIDPSGQATGGLVNYFLRQRAVDQALAWAKRGVEASKSNRAAKEAMGDALSQLGQVDEARALWLETAKLKDDQTTRIQAVARNWVKLAKKSRRGGDFALAERLLRRAAAFDPKNAEMAAEFAVTLEKNAQPGLAKNWAKKALELDPSSEAAQGVLSNLK